MMARLSSTTARKKVLTFPVLLCRKREAKMRADINFVSALFNMADKVERLPKEVENLKDIASFSK